MMTFTRAALLIVLSLFLTWTANAQTEPIKGSDPKAEAVIAKAIESLGGERYLRATSQIGKGKYSVFRDGTVVSFQSFTDVIVFPDRERTEFKGNGSRTIQANSGDSGWVYDADQKIIRAQNEAQISNFKLGLRTSIDYLLRGAWRGDGEMTYIGKRPATLGMRNDVIKLAFKDGFTVEFEFADDGMPQKALYSITAVDGEMVKEEDRYAQFVDINGIKAPFVVDRFRSGRQASRINYESIEFNRTVSDAYFAKPATAKDIKSDIK